MVSGMLVLPIYKQNLNKTNRIRMNQSKGCPTFHPAGKFSAVILLVPREIKPQEGRVALLPDGAREILEYTKEEDIDLEIYIESGAGALSGATDEDYLRAGARIAPNRETLEAIGDEAAKKGLNVIILKVKEPLDIEVQGRRINEFSYLGPGKILYTFFHFAFDREMTERILKSGVSCVALEAIEGDASICPLLDKGFIEKKGFLVPEPVRQLKLRKGKTHVCLDPMSIVAGIEAVLQVLIYINKDKEKIVKEEVKGDWQRRNRILEGYHHLPEGENLEEKHILITGGGTAGLASAWMALRLGATVTITDTKENIDALKEIFKDGIKDKKVEIVQSPDLHTPEGFEQMVRLLENSEAAIGAALVPAGKAPLTINKKAIIKASDKSPKRRVFIDIAIDQGGNLEFVKPDKTVVIEPKEKMTYHYKPVRVGYGKSIFYLVANMPGGPGVICRVASEMLQAARLPYIKLMLHGLKEAAYRDEGFAKGISILAGKLIDRRVGEEFGIEWFDISQSRFAKVSYSSPPPIPDPQKPLTG